MYDGLLLGNFVVFSVVEYLLTMVLCLCFDLCVVDSVGICVDVWGVVCVVESSLFHESGCCYVV